MKGLLLPLIMIFLLIGCKEEAQEKTDSSENKTVERTAQEEEKAVAKTVAEVKPAVNVSPEETTATVEKEEPKKAEETEPSEVKAEVEKVAVKENVAPAKTKKAPKKKGAKISFIQKSYNFGKIKEGEKVSHSFEFENTGDKPLEILSVDVTCGCTTPTYSFMPFSPGEKGKIDVTFDSKNKIGRQKPTITVLTNSIPAVQKIYLEGYVEYVPSKKKEEEEKVTGEEEVSNLGN